MEAPVYKNSSVESQDENVNLSVDKKGLFNSDTVFSLKNASSESKGNLKIIKDSSTEINGYIDIRCMTPTIDESLQLSELAAEKTCSPTLIKSAIQVMKNLFSPEKVKRKSAGVISPSNNSKNTSPSPSITSSNPGEANFFTLEPENEMHSNIHIISGENNTKSFSQSNESEILQTPLTLDPLNNTDESFMTTVSLIDDSFHSAVTNLDENGEFLRNCVNLKDNILNDSRNSDLVDPSNNTLENNDSCLENTTLKIDNFSDENKFANFSLENFSSTQTHGENSHLDDSEKGTPIQTQYGNSSIKSEKDLQYKVLGPLTEINSKEEAQDVGFQENFKKSAQAAVIPEITNTMESADVADIYLNKSFGDENEQNKSLPNGFVSNIPKETLEKLNEETETDVDYEIHLGNTNNKDCLGNSISTTTIVLNTGESVDLENMLMYLKGDDSGTNTSSLTFDGEEVMCSLENEVPESETHHSNTRNSLLLTQQKRYCVSEGNSPNRSESTKIKLNKSDELLNRRIFSEPFEKNLNSDKSLADFSLMKYSEASKMLRKSETVQDSQNLKLANGLENNKSGVDSPSKKTDMVTVISQQSYTILNVHDKSLNRPVIEPLNISSDPSEKSFPKNDSMHSTELGVVEKCYGNNSSNGSFDTEDLVKTSQIKQSTPLCEGNNENSAKFFRPTILKLHSPEISESVCDETKLIENFGKGNLSSKTAKQIFSNSESIDGFSPVNQNDGTEVVFGNSIEDEAGINHQDHVISNFKEQIKINQSPCVKSAFNKSKKSPSDGNEAAVLKLNQTFDKKKQNSLRSKDQTSQEKSEPRSTHSLNQTFEKKSKSPGSNSKNRSLHEYSKTPKQDKLNVTFDIISRSPSSNTTFTKEKRPPEIGEANPVSESPESTLLNKTYDKPLCNQLNQTFSKSSESSGFRKVNISFDEKSESPTSGKTIQVSDGMVETQIRNEANQTFVLEKNQLEKLVEESEQTNDVKDSDMFDGHVESVSKIENTSSKGNETCEKKIEASGTSQKPLLNEGQPHMSSILAAGAALHYRSNHNTDCSSHNDANDSFVSTKSSNTSLFCSDISTVVFNEEDCSANRSIDDLSGKLGKMDLNENTKQDSDLCFASKVIPKIISYPKKTEEQILPAEENFLSSFKDDKLPCDPELVQLIREQFSSNDIEKICSVVQDLSSTKLSNDILKASEHFDKSFHENSSDVESKISEIELDKVKTINALSPQSFDFLNSIGGKPTGRDLSRESLYVKFDPLVQPSANSLIDFTKEGEALAVNDASPVSAHSSSICEQLLTISPQKKPDAIVPPLTPLSHKEKADSNEDKLERLNELQNEIYFLKNLYAERERLNKTKMEEYENQIAKLTGEGCMFEDKLKESNEREKSLVKKLKEQTQSIGQLKIIMEEYVKVISKLSSELEALKNENFKKLESLSLEKDSYMTHLQNTEAAFTDVHAKYEKSKKTIVSLKANETLYRNTITEQAQKIEEFKSRAKEAQEKALMGFQKIQEELNQTKTSHSQEAARLKAQLRKTELKVEALQESLDQKIKENQQLTAICDELIEGKK